MKNISRIKVFVYNKIGRILLGRISGRFPENVIRSIEEFSYDPKIRKHIKIFNEVSNQTFEDYLFSVDYPPYFIRKKTFEKRNIYLLNDVILSPVSGCVWLESGYIFQESVGSLNRLIGWGSVLHEPLQKAEKLDGEEIHICMPDTGYFHWMFEILPSFLIARSKFPNSKIIISERASKYIYETLKFIIGEDYLQHVIIHQRPLKIKNVAFVQQLEFSGFIQKDDLLLLRNAFKKLEILPNSESKCVYITRQHTKKRRLENEDELVNKLIEKGVEIINAEELSFIEQIKKFSNVEMIIAPHGAGLSNMAWAKPGTKVLEIFPENMFNDCYARIAVNLGFDYSYLVCDKSEKSDGQIPIKQVIEFIKRQK